MLHTCVRKLDLTGTVQTNLGTKRCLTYVYYRLWRTTTHSKISVHAACMEKEQLTKKTHGWTWTPVLTKKYMVEPETLVLVVYYSYWWRKLQWRCGQRSGESKRRIKQHVVGAYRPEELRVMEMELNAAEQKRKRKRSKCAASTTAHVRWLIGMVCS